MKLVDRRIRGWRYPLAALRPGTVFTLDLNKFEADSDGGRLYMLTDDRPGRSALDLECGTLEDFPGSTEVVVLKTEVHVVDAGGGFGNG